MLKLLKIFLPTLIAFLLLDMVWLGFIAKKIYAKNIGYLLQKSGQSYHINPYAGITVYILLVLGILFFVIPKANGSYLHAILIGGLFGFITYGVYDLTNYSILANWPLKITIIDLVWGTVVCAMVSFVAMFFEKTFG